MFCMAAQVSYLNVFYSELVILKSRHHMKSADSSDIIRPSSITFTQNAAENRPKTFPLETHLRSNTSRRTVQVLLHPTFTDLTDLILVYSEQKARKLIFMFLLLSLKQQRGSTK